MQSIEILSRKVKKFYPFAKSSHDSDGFFIAVPEFDMEAYDEVDIETTLNNGYVDLFDEFVMPHTTTEQEAWNVALLCCRTTQNLNRTHPERLSLEHDEDWEVRINDRMQKIQTSRIVNKDNAGV